jgi:hypothetical protein
MKITGPKQRVILEAVIDGSVIRGTLRAASGDRRDFHGWLELNTALEAALDPAARASGENRAASPGGPSQRSRYAAHPSRHEIRQPACRAIRHPGPPGRRSKEAHKCQAPVTSPQMNLTAVCAN